MIKKITIPVQIILCFSARNINSKLIQVISFFNIVDYYFMKKKISFIFIHLICCAHFAGLVFLYLFSFDLHDLSFITSNKRGHSTFHISTMCYYLDLERNIDMIHTRTHDSYPLLFIFSNCFAKSKQSQEERYIKTCTAFLTYFFYKRGGVWVTGCFELLSSSCKVPGSN